MRLRARVIALGLVVLCMASEAVAVSDIKGVRLWRAPDNTRLVFDLSAAVQHKVFTLTAPNRLVIDVQDARLVTALKNLDFTKTPIKGIRAAQRSSDGRLRVVVDLSRAVTPKSFSLAPNQQYGDRLVVDLYDSAQLSPQVATSPVQPVKPQPIPSGKRDIVVAIDAGHGGEDPGALSPVRGRVEKQVTLAIAKDLQRQISAMKGFKGVLVRTGDYFIALRKRTDIARKKGADLFISIHADAAPSRSAYGASVYALSDRGATSETARWLANAENQSDLIGGAGNVSLDDKDKMLAGVLLDLSMTASMSASLNVGQKVLNNIGKITSLHKRRVEQAGFMVLKSPDMPSILVETGFISNPRESNKLASSKHQQALARSISLGVKQFFERSPPPGTYLAWLRDTGKLVVTGPREHVVSSGESLALIAARYEVSLSALKNANSLRSELVKVGQTLRIPATALAAKP